MKKTFKSMFAFMLVVVMTVSLFGTMAFADGKLVNVNIVGDGIELEDDVKLEDLVTVTVPETEEGIVEDGVKIVPEEGYYVASVKVGDESVMSCVEAKLDSTEIVVDFADANDEEDEGLTYTEGMTLTVKLAGLPEEVEASVVKETLYGSHVFSEEALVADNGVYTIAPAENIEGLAYYNWSYALLSNGAMVEIDDVIKSEALLSFTVYHKYIAHAELTIDPAQSTASTTTAASVATTADVAEDEGRYVTTNVVVTIGGDVLEEGEYALYEQVIIPSPVEKIPLTITAPSKEVTYNGQAVDLSDDKFEVTYSGALKEGDKIEAVVEFVTDAPGDNEVINAGGPFATQIKSFKVMRGTQDVSAEYEVTPTKGAVTVKPAPIKVEAKDSTVVYDGASHTAGDYNITEGQLFNGDTLEIAYEGSATNVSDGKVTSKITSAAVKGENASNYNVTFDGTKGSITITARPITFTAKNGTAAATGNKITSESTDKNNVTITTGSLAEGDELISIATKAEGTNAGTVPVVASAALIKRGTADVTANYNITYVNGTFTITANTSASKGTVTVTFSGSKVYDGKPLTQTYTWEADTEAKKTVSSIEVAGATVGPEAITKQLTDADVTITLKGADGKSLNSADYNIVVVPGNVVIQKAPLSLKPSDASKNYDGKEYVGKINGTPTFEGEKLTITANVLPYLSGNKSQGIAVGSYVLKVDLESVLVKDSKGNDITANFNITSSADATLKVKASIGSANYSKSAGGTVTINATLPRNDLASVVVDGKTLVKDTDYTINTNSSNTVITFKNEFLKNLSVGSHSVVYYYNNAGSISTTLTVSATGSTTSTQAAQTGDSSNMTLWIVIAAIAFVAMVAIVVVLVKQKKQGKAQD